MRCPELIFGLKMDICNNDNVLNQCTHLHSTLIYLNTNVAFYEVYCISTNNFVKIYIKLFKIVIKFENIIFNIFTYISFLPHIFKEIVNLSLFSINLYE